MILFNKVRELIFSLTFSQSHKRLIFLRLRFKTNNILILSKMNKTQKRSNGLTLLKTHEKLTKTVFNWDTTELEKEVFSYVK